MTSSLSHVEVSPKVFASHQFVRGLPAGRGVRPFFTNLITDRWFCIYLFIYFIFYFFFLFRIVDRPVKLANIGLRIHGRIVPEGGCCQPWGRVSCCTVVHPGTVCFKDSITAPICPLLCSILTISPGLLWRSRFCFINFLLSQTIVLSRFSSSLFDLVNTLLARHSPDIVDTQRQFLLSFQ